jgi:hypothetical protein
MNKDFPDDGGPHNNKCTGLSDFVALSKRSFTSSKPTISSNRLCLVFLIIIGLLF